MYELYGPDKKKDEDRVETNTQTYIGAAICSFFIPGLGQLMKGQNKRAVIMFIGVFSSPFIFGALLLIFSILIYEFTDEDAFSFLSIFYWIAILIVWGFNILDAYQTPINEKVKNEQ